MTIPLNAMVVDPSGRSTQKRQRLTLACRYSVKAAPNHGMRRSNSGVQVAPATSLIRILQSVFPDTASATARLRFVREGLGANPNPPTSPSDRIASSNGYG